MEATTHRVCSRELERLSRFCDRHPLGHQALEWLVDQDFQAAPAEDGAVNIFKWHPPETFNVGASNDALHSLKVLCDGGLVEHHAHPAFGECGELLRTNCYRLCVSPEALRLALGV